MYRQGWAGIRPESHRYPRPCGFFIRSFPSPGLLRRGFLLVDAAQGVEAQTMANLFAAMEHDLEIIPVINKIDLPSADIERTKEQIEMDLGLDSDLAILCSAKEGTGVDDVLAAIVEMIPPPTGSEEDPLAALIFDAHYDPFRGTIVSCRVFSGRVRPGDTILLMHNNASYRVEEVGLFKLAREPKKSLSAGEVGYIISGIKTVSDTRIGDTVTLEKPTRPPHPFPDSRKSNRLCSLPYTRWHPMSTALWWRRWKNIN
jgi:GTP-binding protein LepA